MATDYAHVGPAGGLVSLYAKLTSLAAMQRELLGLAQVMVGLLKHGELAAMDDAWAKRERLFPQLLLAYQELKPWLADWSGSLAGLPPERAAQAQALMDELSRQGRQILALDEQAKVLLKAELERLGADLSHLGQGQRLSRAYRSDQAPPCPTQVSRVG